MNWTILWQAVMIVVGSIIVGSIGLTAMVIYPILMPVFAFIFVVGLVYSALDFKSRARQWMDEDEEN